MPVVVEPILNKKPTFDEQIHLLAVKYGQDEILARKIIACESSMYPSALHVNKNGTKDFGAWQINEIHRDNALALGYNIYNETDNLEFGFLLLKEQGTRPWNASKHCWLR